MSIFISVCFFCLFVFICFWISIFINTFTSVWVIVVICIFLSSNLTLRFRFQLITIVTIGWIRAEYRYNKNSPRNVGVLQRAQKQAKVVACVAAGICVGVLYCFGGGATRRVGIQVNLKLRKPGCGLFKIPKNCGRRDFKLTCIPTYLGQQQNKNGYLGTVQ